MKNKKKVGFGCNTERSSIPLTSKKSSYKHSRKPTSEPPKLYQLINSHFKKSKQLHDNQILVHTIDSLIYGNTTSETIRTQEIIIDSSRSQYCKNLYVLSKNKTKQDQQTIQMNLMKVIRGKEDEQKNMILMPHFDLKIQPIMSKYAQKMKTYHKKIKFIHRVNHINLPHSQFNQKNQKELPTIISFKESSKSAKNTEQHNNLYQSFELQALTQCIKKMFQKQNTTKGQSISKIVQNSWLKGDKNDQHNPLSDCQYSSIYPIFDTKIRSSGKWTQPEEMYGLADIKKRYQESKQLELQSKISNSKHLGHRRNPTDAPIRKEYFHKDPLTPRNNPARSAFGSFKNLPLQTQRTNNSKDPYSIKFNKKKKHSSKFNQNVKQNHKQPKKAKVVKTQVKSKSKSRDKSSSLRSAFIKKF